MNAELMRKALEKVGSPQVLINMVSRRVRQLTSGQGGLCRPLVADCEGLQAGDIALREIAEDKMGFDIPDLMPAVRPVAKKRRPAR